VREAYLGNAVAQRAVKLVVEGVGSAPLDGSDPALVALVTARSGGQMLIETVAAQLLLHGNSYVQVLRDADGGATAATADGTRAFGTLQYLASGTAGDFSASPQERLIDLVQALRAPYRQGASFVMNASTLARIRKFKTSDGAFV
jgi:hypothetical protein